MRLSPVEIEEGAPLVGTVEEASRAFRERGFVLFENALARGHVEALRAAFFSTYGGLSADDLLAIGSRVGDERFMFAIDLSGPFLDPRVYANPYLMPVIGGALGEGFVLDSYACVVAYPGAKDQHLHLDHSLLFPEDEAASLRVPAYALTLVVPLVDIGPASGSTRLFERRGRAEPSLLDRVLGGNVVEAEIGAAWIMDYRLAHGGTANPSQVPRPILYLVYARKWFSDAENFEARPRLQLPPDLDVPAAYRALFRRAHASRAT
jgi:hypothetical protein